MTITKASAKNKVGIDKGKQNVYGSKPCITLHGMVTVGPKGQIVIPASARRELAIGTGDQLMTIVKLGKVVGFFKANLIEELQKAIGAEIKNIKKQY